MSDLTVFTIARLEHLADVKRGLDDPNDAGFYETCAMAAAILELRTKYQSALATLLDIADMGRTKGCESARNKLIQLGVNVPNYGSMT